MADEIPDLLAHLDMTCRHGVDLDMDECDECAARPVPQGTEDSPEVVCICGSMRFLDLMLAVAADETAAGRIVLMPFAVVAPVDQGSDFKRMLDTLHRRKIDLSGRVIVVMDESEYYGESTRGEIEYASKTGKVVSFQTVERTAEDSDYREQIARAVADPGKFVRRGYADANGVYEMVERWQTRAVAAAVSPLVEQLRQVRAAYNRMAGHAVDRAAERDRYYLAWQSAARGRRRARVERGTARNQFLDHYNGTAGQLDRIRELQDALRERTGQRDEARAERELARESRDQYHKNWDAAVAANMTALDTIGGLRADLETRTCERDYARAELAAVGRAIECFLGVEYGTPVESARALVERCADAESALDGLRTTAVVLDRKLGATAPSATYQQLGYLLNQYDRLLSAVEHIRMDTPEDRDRHARVIATFRRAAEPVREQVEGAAPPEVEITDEHVREHDDAAPTRDAVVEAWADTWNGVDRTPEWVRVVEPCPVPECTIPQVHGHEGYGLRFTPAAQPAHPRPPLDPPPNSLNERLHIRRSGARLGPMDPSDVVKHCVRCGCPQGAHHKLHCDGRLGDCICPGGFEDSPDYVLTALDKVGQAENAEWDAEHRAGGSPGAGTEAGE